MKNLFLGLAAIASTGMISCNKEEIQDIFSDISSEEETLNVRSAGFEINEVQPIIENDFDAPTEGIIEYVKDGEVLATVDYSEGAADELEVTKPDGKHKKKCKKDHKKGKKFKKVIVQPIVKSDDCDYIVSGIIKFFNKDGWVATIDFGDGTCDDIATKTTADGTHTFTLKSHNK